MERSKWKSEITYNDTLSAALNNVKGEDGNWSHMEQSWEFSYEDINQVKQYVLDNGMGNYKRTESLIDFYNLFK